MDPIDFGYSMKNIPIAAKGRYKLALTEKVESVLKRMRWKAHFFDENRKNGQHQEPEDTEEDRGKVQFKSRKCPKQMKDMRLFEDEMAEMIK